MPDVRVYVFSLLAVRRAALQETFLSQFPHPWLVWEPVVWKPSTQNPLTSQTLPASFSRRPTERPEGDALCYPLTGERLLIGRAPHCDIRINDAAVSREHLFVEPDPAGGWRVVPASIHVSTLLDGQPLRVPGAALNPHAELRLGGVLLRFEDPRSMAERLLQAARE